MDPNERLQSLPHNVSRPAGEPVETWLISSASSPPSALPDNEEQRQSALHSSYRLGHAIDNLFQALNLSDPAENSQLLNDQLRAMGLYAAPTLGDGNCLFRALSDQLYGTPAYHLRLREEICNWIASHKQRYAPFVDDERGLDVHLECMRQPGM